MIKLIKRYSNFNPPVIIGSLSIVLGLSLCALLIPQISQTILQGVRDIIFEDFSWFYVLSISLFFIFNIFLALSSLGDIKLGSDDEEAEFSYTAWLAMLFAAGTGVGLMFFGTAEPLSHYHSAVSLVDGTSSAKEALFHSIFHWGINAWTVYGIMALALAYFGFRYKLPLSLRSCFYPLWKDKINGPRGHIIDIIALCVTLLGIVTTLGFGAAQLGAGFLYIDIISTNDFSAQTVIIIIIMSIAVLSAVTGIDKGVKLLSEINISVALVLMLFVLCAGPTLLLLNTMVENFGYYLSHILGQSFYTSIYTPETRPWFFSWTILFWAWWLSWAPFVGMFIARISKGRTIREFIFGVLIIPTVFTIVWFTIFGNTAIYIDETVANGALGALTNKPEQLLFAFLEYLPLSGLTSILSIIVLALFFITSADSGIYVLNNIAAYDKSTSSPKWQCLMWGSVMSFLAISLLSIGGLNVLQSVTLILALPFAALMVIMCYSLWQGLLTDTQYFNTKLSTTSIYWDSKNWKQGLAKILNQTQSEDVISFMKTTALPAMYQLNKELTEEYGLTTRIDKHFNGNDASVELTIEKESMRNFTYGIKLVTQEVSDHLIEDPNIPHITESTNAIPMTYFSDGRAGYDAQYMTREDIITDIIRQYERYLTLSDDVGYDIMAHDAEEAAE